MTTETSIYEYAKQELALLADKTAIWFYGKSITYRELFERIDNVADHLYQLGVREGTVVTIHLPNCPQAIMAIYAVAKLGGICDMIHPLMPEAALQESMALTESKLLITYKADASAIAGKAFLVDVSYYMGLLYKNLYRLKNGREDSSFEALAETKTSPAVLPNPATLADRCVVYLHSSGTEGTPKTVMHSHFAMNSWEADADAYYGHWNQSHRSIYCVLPYYHGFGLVTGLHHGMVNKMEQIVAPRFSADETVRLLHKRRANIIIGTPALFEKLMKSPKFNGDYLPHLEECTVGGDCASAALFSDYDRRLDPTGKNKYLYEGYGLTEVISATSYNNVHFSYREGTAGTLLPGLEARVRKNGVVSRIGEGEILISGNTMMMGYFKSEDQPFIEFEGKTWLPTGDFGKLDEDGFISCTGRIKDIIIHNGYDVIPSRVEAVIKKSPQIEEVCVTGEAKESSSTQRVVAWIVVMPGVDNKTILTDLRERCKKELAPFEWPAEFRRMTALPRNNMRKVEKRVMREMQWETL